MRSVLDIQARLRVYALGDLPNDTGADTMSTTPERPETGESTTATRSEPCSCGCSVAVAEAPATPEREAVQPSPAPPVCGCGCGDTAVAAPA